MSTHEPEKAESFLIRGRLILDCNARPTLGWLRIENRLIAEIHEGDPPRDEPCLGGRDHVISPAFVDAHTHLPQIDSIGCDDLGLLEWLDRVIFPAEQWWGAGAGAHLGRRAGRRYLHEGTCAVAGYLTSHSAVSREVAAQLASETPLRWMLGRVAMDREAPDALTAEDRARASNPKPPSPVMPSFGDDSRCEVSANPRFAISCTEELLAEIGWHIRDNPGTAVQTHLCETLPEIARVKELFPDDANYTAVYDRAGLLTDRTLLAHCVHLSDAEWELIAARNSTIVHCPTANTFLRAGLFDFGRAREMGIKLALGTDVAAGTDFAMPRVARAAIEVAKMRAMTIDPNAYIPTPAEMWGLITCEGADALGWRNTSRLAVGAEADVLVLRVPETWLDEHLIGRLLYNWSPDLIEQRVLNGRRWESV